MRINWKVRLTSPKFYITVVIPVIVIIVSSLFNNIDTSQLTQILTNLITMIFALIAFIGGIIDHTTTGISDSTYVLSRNSKLKRGDKK